VPAVRTVTSTRYNPSMAVSPWLWYGLAVAGAAAVSRVWVRFKFDRRARQSLNTPLFEQELLASALELRPADGDDPAVLEELLVTMTHLNSQAYVQEFWTLDKQLTTFYGRLPAEKRPTMRRAILRLLTLNDRFLQRLGAKTCASIGFTEAVRLLRAIISVERDAPQTVRSPGDQSATESFLSEIEGAATALEARAQGRRGQTEGETS
jgi:hypothetical protein